MYTELQPLRARINKAQKRRKQKEQASFIVSLAATIFMILLISICTN